MVTWGAWTVGNAMNVKRIKIGRPSEINCGEDARAQGKKILAISQELWDDSITECKQPIEAEEICGKFSAKIFDWAKKHVYD